MKRLVNRVREAMAHRREDPICGHCTKPIKGRVVVYRGRTYHLACAPMVARMETKGSGS